MVAGAQGVTQEALASILGVRREGITEAVGRLQTLGLISCRRGHIRVLSRAGLEQRVCECYGVMRREAARLLAPYQSAHAPHPVWQARNGQRDRRVGGDERRSQARLDGAARADDAGAPASPSEAARLPAKLKEHR